MRSCSTEDTLTRTEMDEVQDFFKGVKMNSELEFDEKKEVQRKQFNHVYKFVSRLVVNDRNHPMPNLFIRYCHSGDYMCNFLVTVGITDIEPLPGDVICIYNTGAHLMAISHSFYSKKNFRNYKVEHLETC